jgi:hypothetical protein
MFLPGGRYEGTASVRRLADERDGCFAAVTGVCLAGTPCCAATFMRHIFFDLCAAGDGRSPVVMVER